MGTGVAVGVGVEVGAGVAVGVGVEVGRVGGNGVAVGVGVGVGAGVSLTAGVGVVVAVGIGVPVGAGPVAQLVRISMMAAVKERAYKVYIGLLTGSRCIKSPPKHTITAHHTVAQGFSQPPAALRAKLLAFFAVTVGLAGGGFLWGVKPTNRHSAKEEALKARGVLQPPERRVPSLCPLG